MAPCQSPADLEIERLCAAGEVEAATTLVLRAYGPEILGFLRSVARCTDRADEAFSVFCEQLWLGLAGFRWPGAFRAWLYRVARNAHHRVLRDPHLRRRRFTPDVGRYGLPLQSTTAMHVRPEARQLLCEFRSRLSTTDQELLVLRLDRDMSWREVATVLSDGPHEDREAARLRKRFQRIKHELRQFVEARRAALERRGAARPRIRGPIAAACERQAPHWG